MRNTYLIVWNCRIHLLASCFFCALFEVSYAFAQARQVSDDNASPMVRLTPDYAASSFKNIDTVDALFRQATVRHASKSCMGTRVVKKETREMEEGKSMVKVCTAKWSHLFFIEIWFVQLSWKRGLAKASRGFCPRTVRYKNSFTVGYWSTQCNPNNAKNIKI